MSDLVVPGHNPVEGPVAVVGPALKPRERSSARPTAAAEEEVVAAQSAKAPESEGNLLVVATTGEYDNMNVNVKIVAFLCYVTVRDMCELYLMWVLLECCVG